MGIQPIADRYLPLRNFEMNIFKTKKDDPKDIFYLNPEKERVNTKSIFEIIKEDGKMGSSEY